MVDIHAVGIDIHQKVILMKDITSHIYGTEKLSLPQPTTLYIIDPDNDHPPQVPASKPQKKSLKSKTEEASMYAL